MLKVFLHLFMLNSLVFAIVDNTLAYPKDTKSITAKDIINQVYFVNHHYAVKDFALEKVGRDVTLIVRKVNGKRPVVNKVIAYIDNECKDTKLASKDLYVFTSGKLKGVSTLITEYKDKSISEEYRVWLPALRRIKKFAEPRHDDVLGEIDFALISDVKMRKPDDEIHELIATKKFNQELQTMTIKKEHLTKDTKKIPSASKEFMNRDVFVVKSTVKDDEYSWYNYRVSYIDTKTFVDYRTEYYKKGEKIKVIDRVWAALPNVDDLRAQRWVTWFSKDLITKNEQLTYTPACVVKFNQNYPDKLWSTKSLKKFKK